MGSLFGKKKGPETKRRAAAPPSEAAGETTAVLKAPEVDLATTLPPEAAARLEQHLLAGARGLLIDPEDEETRIFAFYDDRLVELGSCDVADHGKLLDEINDCRNGAVSAQGRRFGIQAFQSLSDFGDRLVVNFMEEGKYDLDGLLARRTANVRLINALKPATSLTRKNILDIHRVVQQNPRDKPFLDVLVEDELVTSAQADQVRGAEDPVLAVLQAHVLPRKAAASALARYLGVEYVDVEAVSFDKRAARKLDKAWSLKQQVVPFAESQGRLKVAMMNPTDRPLIEQITGKTGCEVTAYLSAAQDIMVMVHKAYKLD